MDNAPTQNRLENLRALRIANLDMAFATAFAALVAGNFLAEFVRHLSGDDRVRGWIGALPSMLGILQIPGSLLGERFESYKKYVGVGGLLWRLWWVPIVFLPLLPDDWPRLEILITCIAMQAISIHLVQPTYNSWLSFLVPESHRGWYFSRRFALAVVVGAVIGFPASVAIDWMRKEELLDLGLTIIFGFGVLFGLISFVFYQRMPDTKHPVESNASIRHSVKSLKAPFSDKPFRRLLLFLVVFVFGQFVAAPFFFYYGREVVHLSLLQLQVFAAFTAVTSLASAPLWGYFSDKYGNKPVLFLAGILLGLGPLSWVFAKPGNDALNYFVLGLGHVSAGFAWTGVGVGQFNFILAVAKPELRAQALGVTQALSAVVSGVAPLAGGVLLYSLRQAMDEAQAYQALFILNAALRVGAVLLLFGIVDATSRGIREFLGQIAGARPSGVLAMRRLMAPDESEREAAIRRLGEAGMKIAETELVALLSDPAPRLRREAAAALKRVGGREALTALLDIARSHPDLVEEEMVDAIGSIGDESAVPVLIALLESPSSALRRASAKALGDIGSPNSLEALMAAVKQQDDPELRRAALQALRKIGDERCEPAVLEALEDRYPSVRVAAAEVCAELRLKRAAPTLRQLLCCEVDESHAEAAYALSVVGGISDLDTVLSVAARMESPVARRRCLLGAARLLGVEGQLYALLSTDPVKRDQVLLDLVRDRSARGIRGAIALYHGGDEPAALARLARRAPEPALALIATHSPKEGFLLALSLLTARTPGKTAGI